MCDLADVAFGDTLKPNGNFQIHTNLGDPPTKANISALAGIKPNEWQYLLSIGGENAPGPPITNEDTYVEVRVSEC